MLAGDYFMARLQVIAGTSVQQLQGAGLDEAWGLGMDGLIDHGAPDYFAWRLW